MTHRAYMTYRAVGCYALVGVALAAPAHSLAQAPGSRAGLAQRNAQQVLELKREHAEADKRLTTAPDLEQGRRLMPHRKQLHEQRWLHQRQLLELETSKRRMPATLPETIGRRQRMQLHQFRIEQQAQRLRFKLQRRR